jgi:hypothetical protein
MEQRPLRLGDTVDDYCPRERRVTNHVIVAIVGDAIRQTRCTTCDADHPFKGVRMTRRKPKDSDAETPAEAVPNQLAPPKPATGPAETSRPAMAASGKPEPGPELSDDQAGQEGESQQDSGGDHWPGHRQLIRAALPKTEGELPPPRPIPEFTMHQRSFGRGGHGYRGHGFGGHGGWSQNGNGNGNGNGNANGNVANPRHGQGQGHGRGPGPGPGQGQGQGQGHGHPRRHRGGKHRRPR